MKSIEHALNLSAEYLLLMQQDDMESPYNSLHKYPVHIYMVCRSPIIKFDSSKTKITSTEVYIEFYVEEEGTKRFIAMRIPNISNQLVNKMETSFPNTKVTTHFNQSNAVFTNKASFILRDLMRRHAQYDEALDLEVLYVGQAYGKDGCRITSDRLLSHEKVQKIYFDTQQRFPEEEIWLLSLTFEPTLYHRFYWNPQSTSTEKTVDEITHMKKIEETPISMEQQITIMEAALIRYFNTQEYNKEYLDFPKKSHKSYNEVYKLDYNSVVATITSKSINARLFSNNVAPSFFHVAKHFLHNEEERKNMFEWFKEH
jgi:hypothetical protein